MKRPSMTIELKTFPLRSLLAFVVIGLVLALSSAMLVAQEGEQELTLVELEKQREQAAQDLADAAAAIDATTASIEELSGALDDIASLAGLHQLRLDEAIDRYDAALDRLVLAEAAHDEVLAEIDVLRSLVSDLALAQFTGESGREVLELALSADPGESARLSHLLELQTGSATDAVDRLRILEFEASELVAERNAATTQAEESLGEMQYRSNQLDAAISQQEQLLESAELRLLSSEADAESAALLIEETEQRLEDWIRGIGAPAPVDRDDIVTISFYEGSSTTPFFQIQVHEDIEEQTRGLFDLAFSQGINLGGWGYRSTERQIQLREAHCGSSTYDIWLKPAGQCSPPTARPGFSKHEQGRAIDFQWNGGSIGPRSGTPFRWLAANAPAFGFVNLPSEPWHWSDGTANVFDPTVPIPDLAEEAVPEVEPDAENAQLLFGEVDTELDGEQAGPPEVLPLVDGEAADGEAVDGEAGESQPAQAGADEAESAGTEAVDPAPPEPDVVESEATAPESGESQPAEPEAIEPEPASIEPEPASVASEAEAPADEAVEPEAAPEG